MKMSLARIYMQEAISLALKAKRKTRPNPLVGAVVVKAGKIIATGYHKKAGGPHAEAEALRKAGKKAVGATLYVSLEPCCHTYKRTPPCVYQIIKCGIRRVVVAMRDPNRMVRGRGVAILRKTGISVSEGLLEKEAISINKVYIKNKDKGFPFVILKAALTLDGKISRSRRSSTWITSKAARNDAHKVRNHVDAVLVGIITILTDNPRLTTRFSGKRGKDPHRIILDSRLRIPFDSRVITQTSRAKTIIATTYRASRKKIEVLRKKGVLVWILPEKQGRVSLKHLMRELMKIQVSILLIEGGAELNASILREGLVDKIIWIIAPIIMGGDAAVPVISDKGPSISRAGLTIHEMKVRRLEDDLIFEGYL